MPLCSSSHVGWGAEPLLAKMGVTTFPETPLETSRVVMFPGAVKDEAKSLIAKEDDTRVPSASCCWKYILRTKSREMNCFSVDGDRKKQTQETEIEMLNDVKEIGRCKRRWWEKEMLVIHPFKVSLTSGILKSNPSGVCIFG